jgi:hypothetical protein
MYILCSFFLLSLLSLLLSLLNSINVADATTSPTRVSYLGPYKVPYSPDLNPIEEFFAELKSFIKPNWSHYEVDPDQRFNFFLA